MINKLRNTKNIARLSLKGTISRPLELLPHPKIHRIGGLPTFQILRNFSKMIVSSVDTKGVKELQKNIQMRIDSLNIDNFDEFVEELQLHLSQENNIRCRKEEIYIFNKICRKSNLKQILSSVGEEKFTHLSIWLMEQFTLIYQLIKQNEILQKYVNIVIVYPRILVHIANNKSQILSLELLMITVEKSQSNQINLNSSRTNTLSYLLSEFFHRNWSLIFDKISFNQQMIYISIYLSISTVNNHPIFNLITSFLEKIVLEQKIDLRKFENIDTIISQYSKVASITKQETNSPFTNSLDRLAKDTIIKNLKENKEIFSLQHINSHSIHLAEYFPLYYAAMIEIYDFTIDEIALSFKFYEKNNIHKTLQLRLMKYIDSEISSQNSSVSIEFIVDFFNISCLFSSITLEQRQNQIAYISKKIIISEILLPKSIAIFLDSMIYLKQKDHPIFKAVVKLFNSQRYKPIFDQRIRGMYYLNIMMKPIIHSDIKINHPLFQKFIFYIHKSDYFEDYLNLKTGKHMRYFENLVDLYSKAINSANLSMRIPLIPEPGAKINQKRLDFLKAKVPNFIIQSLKQPTIKIIQIFYQQSREKNLKFRHIFKFQFRNLVILKQLDYFKLAELEEFEKVIDFLADTCVPYRQKNTYDFFKSDEEIEEHETKLKQVQDIFIQKQLYPNFNMSIFKMRVDIGFNLNNPYLFDGLDSFNPKEMTQSKMQLIEFQKWVIMSDGLFHTYNYYDLINNIDYWIWKLVENKEELKQIAKSKIESKEIELLIEEKQREHLEDLKIWNYEDFKEYQDYNEYDEYDEDESDID